MAKNMIRPHRNATAIQTISIRSSGCFHQSRFSGDWTAMTAAPPPLPGDRDLDQLHDPPDDVEDGRNRHPEEQQQKGVVEHPLHDGNALAAGRRSALTLLRGHLSRPPSLSPMIPRR